MSSTTRFLASIALAATTIALPTPADSPSATGNGANGSQGALVNRRPPEQNPCQTQLVADLQECEDEFCPGVFNCNEALQAACIAGARAANKACLNDLH